MDTENLKGNISATIVPNPEDSLNTMRQVLTESSNSVYLGIYAIERLSEQPEEYMLSEDGFHSYGPYGLNIRLEDKQEIARNWILNKGFEDLVRAATNSMISLGILIDFNQRLKSKNNRMTFPELKETITDPDIHHKSSKLFFKHLLNKIQPYLKDELSFVKHIWSMQEIRNLLVHRNGKATHLDIKENNEVSLLWMRPKGFFVNDETGQSTELRKEIVMQGPGNIDLKFEETSRQFTLGQPINISFKEFSEMVYTVELFGLDLIEKFRL